MQFSRLKHQDETVQVIVTKSYEVTKNLSYLWAVTRCRQVFGIVGEDGTMTFSTYSRQLGTSVGVIQDTLFGTRSSGRVPSAMEFLDMEKFTSILCLFVVCTVLYGNCMEKFTSILCLFVCLFVCFVCLFCLFVLYGTRSE